jgi:MerR family transcriptional regulator, light-induced transcriptional regulator
MPAQKLPRKVTTPSTPAPAPAGFRSGAVARLVGMPVATLRIWERRYGISAPALTNSGQRLYSGADVRRLVLLKQLSDRGHAIGSLAPLDMRQLQGVVATLFNTTTGAVGRSQDSALLADSTTSLSAPPAHPAPCTLPVWRVAVVGSAMAERLQQRALLRQVGRPLMVVGVFESAAQAAKGLKRQPVDVLLIEAASLQAGWLANINTTAPALKGVKKAVLYGFASEAVCAQLDSQGVALLRAPQASAVVGQWLRGLAQTPATQGPQSDLPVKPASRVKSASNPKWTAAALATFAKQASGVACECPQHLTELLTRLSDFETYSAECAKQGPVDAELHAYLRQTAASARATFETALERVALHEGLPVPVVGA